MSPSPNAQRRQARFRKLKRWFDGVAIETEWLVQNGQTFQELQVLVSSSRRLQQVGVNWSNHWIAANFAIGTAVRIRAMADKDKRTRSLYRVLEEIEADPSVFTRRRFHRQCFLRGGGTREEANRMFDRIAGRGRDVIDPSRVKRDRERLAAKLRWVKRYVDKRAAHLERGWGRRGLRLGTVIRALRVLERMTKKYHALFMGRPADAMFGLHRWDEWKKFFAADDAGSI